MSSSIPTIEPTLCLRGNVSNIRQKYSLGAYSTVLDVPQGVDIKSSAIVSIAKIHGKTLEDATMTVKERGGGNIVIATTNHPQFEMYNTKGGKVEMGGRCLNCVRDFTHQGIGKIIAARVVITTYTPSTNPEGVYESTEYITYGSGVAASTPSGATFPPTPTREKKWIPTPNLSIPPEGIIVKRYAFWHGVPFCSFNCNLRYLKKTMAATDILYIESEMFLKLLFSLCHPEEKTLVPAPDTELCDYQDRGSLKESDIKGKKFIYVPNPAILLIPAKIPFFRQDA